MSFGIGTGRIAIPLRARGISVYGVDLSPDMVAALRDRPGGVDVPVTIGAMATVRVEREFTLIYAVWNTFINLSSQDEQVQCFRNAAAHLIPGGYFVVETLVPRLEGLSLGRRSAPPPSDPITPTSMSRRGRPTHQVAALLERWRSVGDMVEPVPLWSGPRNSISWGASPEWHSSPDRVVGFASRLPGRARRRSRCSAGPQRTG